MIIHSLKVLVVEDDADYAGLVQRWLSAPSDGMGFDFVWTDSFQSAKARLARGGIDVVLLDLGLPDSDGLITFAELRQVQPTLPIIVLSAGDSEAVALQAIQQGAQDYLVKSSCTKELLVRAVRYAHLRHLSQLFRAQSPQQPEGPRVIGLLGAKGGVGVTTVACILADELCAQTEQRVLLADLDIHSNSVSFLLGTEPKFSLADAVGNRDRLDRTLWQAMVTGDGTRLDVLSSPGPLSSTDLTGEQVHQVFSFARSLYDWIVLDLGRLQSLSASLLPLVTDVILVTTASIPALYESKRLVEHLTAHEVDRERLRLVINHADRTESLPASDLNKLFGTRVFAQIPSDAASIQEALLRKGLPSEGSSIREHVRSIARTLAGIEQTKSKPKGVVPNMFSFFTKPKRGAGLAVEVRD